MSAASGQGDSYRLPTHARRLFKLLIVAADREALQMLCPLLARLVETMNRSK